MYTCFTDNKLSITKNQAVVFSYSKLFYNHKIFQLYSFEQN